jgi:hypothetical protein
MKPEHKSLSPIELCLLTWYKPDNPLYRDPTHPTIKLAGEIGELLDLYGKEKYKPGFDWMNCKCRHGEHKGKCLHFWAWDSEDGKSHLNHYCQCKNYVPIVLDELGDILFYLRILAWMWGNKDIDYTYSHLETELDLITDMYNQANCILQDRKRNIFDTTRLQIIYGHLINLLDTLGDYTIEQLTELNYYKLNSEETNHGWKDAR